VRAAERQVRAIERLEAAGRLAELSPRLRIVADARRAHPEADLEALADVLQIGRSAVHHRLRRIEQLAG
jgi:DNA-binding protein WhiA